MAKKEQESEKEKVAEDLTPEKDPKGGRALRENTTIMATNSTLAAPTTTIPTASAPVRRR